MKALIDAGVIRPVIDRVFAFDDTLDALAYVETGRATGKVIVTVTGAPTRPTDINRGGIT